MLEMGLNEYQERAMETCLPESENFAYMFLNLVGELGELSSKVGKMIRKGQMELSENELLPCGGELGWDGWKEFERELRLEAGDVLWQLSGLCSVMGWSLDDVAVENLAKLSSRKDRGVIDGEGDER